MRTMTTTPTNDDEDNDIVDDDDDDDDDALAIFARNETTVDGISVASVSFLLARPALQQIAGLNAISRSIPVTVDLRLTAD